MANFEKPADWSVAPAGNWVSKEALQDRGAPQLGDPSYAEKSACECDSEDYDEGVLSTLANKKVLTSEGFQGHCPPHMKADEITGVCMPNPDSEAKSPFSLTKSGNKDKDSEKDKWALDTLEAMRTPATQIKPSV